MKVALVAVNSKFSHTNLALRLIKQYSDYPALFFEFTINEPIGFIVSEIYRSQPDIICFSVYIWNVEFVTKCAATLKNVLPEVKIILGGPEVSYDSVEYLAKYSFVDAVMAGEGEITYKLLYENNFEFKGINGVVYKDNGNIITNESAIFVQNIDTLPFPYTEDELTALGDKLLYYESSRGCPYNCSYCISSTIHSLRFASVIKVKSDLKRFISHGVRIVKFIDRTFNADAGRAYEIFDFLIKNGGNTRFHFEISAHILNDEILTLLSSAPDGLFQFEIGVQSTNNDVIKAINRKTDFGKLSSAVKKLLSYKNIHLHLDLIAGLPFEDINSFKRSFNDVFELRPHMLQLGFLKLLKGTQIRREYMTHGDCFTDYPPYEFLQNNYMSYSDTLLLKDIENVTEKYYNSGMFVRTIEHFLTFFETPFDMFYRVYSYFKENGFDKLSLSRNSLYDIFAGLLRDMNDEFGIDCLKFDYFHYNKANTSPLWSDSGDKPKRFDIIEKYRDTVFKDFGAMPSKEIVKHVIFEEFDYNIFTGLKEKLMIVFFKNGEYRLIKKDGGM